MVATSTKRRMVYFNRTIARNNASILVLLVFCLTIPAIVRGAIRADKAYFSDKTSDDGTSKFLGFSRFIAVLCLLLYG